MYLQITLPENMSIHRLHYLVSEIISYTGENNTIRFGNGVIKLNLSEIDVKESKREECYERIRKAIEMLGHAFVESVTLIKEDINQSQTQTQAQAQTQPQSELEPSRTSIPFPRQLLYFPNFTQELLELAREGTRILYSFSRSIHGYYDEAYGRIIDASYQKITIMLDEPHEFGQYHTLTWEDVLERKCLCLDRDSEEHWRALEQKRRECGGSWIMEYIPKEDALSGLAHVMGTINFGRRSSSFYASNRREAIEKMYALKD